MSPSIGVDVPESQEAGRQSRTVRFRLPELPSRPALGSLCCVIPMEDLIREDPSSCVSEPSGLSGGSGYG
jgi:hypothetical protein